MRKQPKSHDEHAMTNYTTSQIRSLSSEDHSRDILYPYEEYTKHAHQ